MSGLIAIVGRQAETIDSQLLNRTINRPGTLNCTSHVADEAYLCAAQQALAPGRDKHAYDGEGLVAFLAGDVVNHQEVDWPAIRRCLIEGETRPEPLTRLRGSFALTLFDIEQQSLWVITDPFAWQPVYISQDDEGVVVSTSLATFLNMPSPPPAANEDWVYEFLFFNYGVGSTTPLAGVTRLPAGTITRYSLGTGEVTQRAYRDRLQRPSTLVGGPAAIEEAVDVFNTVVPRYFNEESSSIIGLSAGLDSRSILAAAPERALDRLDSFTYGVPGSSEIIECDRIARQLRLRHTPVPLGTEFQQALPQLASDTVFLSDGLQNVNRSHLLYVYGSLRNEGEPYAVLLTGISGDHIFRDHVQGWGNVPHMMSADMAMQHREGRSRIDSQRYLAILQDRFSDFEARIESVLDQIENTYGQYRDPQAYLSYLMYEVGPRYFSGEAAIANTVSTFRNPYWDPDIVNLGYRLRDATLGFSAARGRKDKYRETRIQAAVVAANARVSRVPYLDMPIQVYSSGNKLAHQFHRGLRRFRAAIRGRSVTYGEDWPKWYRTAMKHEISRLLGDDSRMRDYVTAEFIEAAIEKSDVHWLGKLITAEHTLRLIENRWRQAGEASTI